MTLARKFRLILLVLAIGGCAGSPDPTAVGPCPPPADTEVLASLTGVSGPTEGDAESGATLFAAECLRCHATHLVDRDSRLFDSYPRLDCPITAASNPAYLRLAIAEGGLAIARKKTMKAFGPQLTPAQMADLVSYLRAGAR